MTSLWKTYSGNENSDFSYSLEEPWGSYRPSALQRLLIGLTQSTFLQRGKFRTWMSKLIMSISSPLDVEFRMCKYRIEPRQNLVDRGILTRPKYNATEIEFLQDVVRDGGVAVDIGSNVGLYSLPIAQAAGPSGQVLSIDANPEMVAHLAFNAQASGLTNITLQHLAVGDRETRADLQIRKEDVAIVRVQESDTGATEMRPLLSIVTYLGLKKIDALKIDIEGHEDSALVPFLQMAPEALLPNRIVIERASKAYDYPGCVGEFERLGYRLIGRTRNNSMYERA